MIETACVKSCWNYWFYF